MSLIAFKACSVCIVRFKLAPLSPMWAHERTGPREYIALHPGKSHVEAISLAMSLTCLGPMLIRCFIQQTCAIFTAIRASGEWGAYRDRVQLEAAAGAQHLHLRSSQKHRSCRSRVSFQPRERMMSMTRPQKFGVKSTAKEDMSRDQRLAARTWPPMSRQVLPDSKFRA
jgi:hypothetical protein